MGDLVETMLRETMVALMTDDRKLVSAIERMDNAVDKLHEAIKLYVTKITRESLDDREGSRAMEVIAFAINLEHIGDIIDKNLMELAAKKIKNRLKFSNEGAAELQAFHRRVHRKPEARAQRFHVRRRQDRPAADRGKGRHPAGRTRWRPKTIWCGCAKGGLPASRPVRCISTFCAT